MISGKYCSWLYDNDNNDIYGYHMAGLRYLIGNRWIFKKTW
jgi:hypothetical protein